LTNLARLLAATEEVASASASLDSARALQSAVAKQHEIGEAPRVQVTRAELEVLRANQRVTQAQGRQKLARAALESLVGPQPDLQAVAWPQTSAAQAPANSVELLNARLQVAYASAASEVVRADYAPALSAGVVADVWSLDRSPFQSENFGLQLAFRMPLFEGGQRRGALRASATEIEAAKIRVEEAQRRANLALLEAETQKSTAQLLAQSYDGDVLPKGEAMLTAMREGYSAGLVTLVEVLEAQQTLVRLRQERVQAVLDLRLAEVNLWLAQLNLPGTEVPR
jgi:cobalt-zinc-cadmium efflux system outer membrane protein